MRKSFSAFLNVLFFLNCYSGPVCLAQKETKSPDVSSSFVGTNSLESEVKTELIPAKASSPAGMSFSGDSAKLLENSHINKNTTEQVITPVSIEDKRNSLYFNTDHKNNASEVVKTFDVIYDPRFGQVFLNTSVEDLHNLGLEYGDSIDVSFSNGFTLLDIPYYSGYSTRTGEPLLVGYHGSDHPALCRNNWYPLWNEAELKDGDSVTIKLRERGKYSSIEKALKLKYSVNREDFSSDEAFANFRAVSGGNLKENLIFRSASPFDNRYNRIKYVDELVKKNKIEFIINLADTDEAVDKFIKQNNIEDSYSVSLYRSGRSINLGMTCNYQSKTYAEKLCCGLLKYLEYCEKNNNGKPVKVLIHCLEGKDRTGFAFEVLGGLLGFLYSELLYDYMKTYENYYGITKRSDPETYEKIVAVKFNDFKDYLNPPKEMDNPNSPEVFFESAKKYLKFGGMTDEQIIKLKNLISK